MLIRREDHQRKNTHRYFFRMEATASRTCASFFENYRGGGGAPAMKNSNAFSRFHRVKFAANGAMDQKWMPSNNSFQRDVRNSGENRPANMANSRDVVNRSKPCLERKSSNESLLSSASFISRRSDTNFFMPKHNRFVPHYNPLGRRSDQTVTGKITDSRIPRGRAAWGEWNGMGANDGRESHNYSTSTPWTHVEKVRGGYDPYPHPYTYAHNWWYVMPISHILQLNSAFFWSHPFFFVVCKTKQMCCWTREKNYAPASFFKWYLFSFVITKM